MKIINAFSNIYPEYIINDFKTQNALSFYENLQGLPILSDRFGYLNQFSTFDVIETKGKNYLDALKNSLVNNLQQYLFDSIQKRTEQIKSLNEIKYIMWSGGIDSTAVLTSFILNDVDIIVVLNNYSIKEYPLFYEKYIKNKLKILEINDEYEKFYAKLCKSGYVITGDCCDQLFGSDLKDTQIFWNDSYKKYVNNKIIIEQFENAFRYYGIDIVKTFDFIWWMNFSCKWDFVSHSISYLTHKNYYKEIAFFDDFIFEVFALNNNHSINVSDVKQYKRLMKLFSYQMTKDDEFLNYKGKGGSKKINIGNGFDKIYFDILKENNDIENKLICYGMFTEMNISDYNNQMIKCLKKGALKWLHQHM